MPAAIFLKNQIYPPEPKGDTPSYILHQEQIKTIQKVYEQGGNLIKYLVSEYIYKYPDKFIGVPHTSTNGSIDVQDLKLSSFNLSLSIGFYKTLYAEVLPNTASNKKVNWRISDGNSECIELIDTGSYTYCIIKGLVSGTVTVEASVENGAFKSSCTITVI